MENTQQTIRLPAVKNNEIKKMAEEIGCSYNSLVTILLDLGMQAYKSKPTYHQSED